MKKKVFLVVVCVLLCFLIGFGLQAFGVFGGRLTAEASSGKKLVSEYFGSAKYEGVIAGENTTSILQYRSGDWVIQTDSTGKNILSVALTPEAAKKAEENQGKALNEDQLVDLAIQELGRYVSVGDTFESKVESEDRGGVVSISLKETKNGRATGAGGYFTYFPDGKLFCFTFSERMEEGKEKEDLMDVMEAYDLAFEYLKEYRQDLEIIYDPDSMNFRQDTRSIGTLYFFDFYGASDKHPEWDTYCWVGVNANSKEVCSSGFEDR